MIDLYLSSDKVLLKEIGQKIKGLRLNANLSQKALAERCGVSGFSISQIENGSNTSLLTLLMILRALNALDMLYRFFEEEPMSPIAYAEAVKKQRKPQRVRKVTNRKSLIENQDSEW